jgi:hypothetical protein
MSQIRPFRTFIVAIGFALTLAGCGRAEKQESKPLPSGFFSPEGARNVLHYERDGVREVSYELDVAYPASAFLCELTHHLDDRHWRGLREDALNPGLESSLVRGWTDFENASVRPATHVHSWIAQWLGQNGDLLTYALRYEYPENTKPQLSTMRVSAIVWPAALVRSQLGGRADDLPVLGILTVPPTVPPVSKGRNERRCERRQWTELVTGNSRRATPVAALPSELARVRSISIQSDIDGIARRIAATLTARIPALRVTTVNDHTSQHADATLDFRAECRCNEAGAPNGFYVREAVLYTEEMQREWTEPARVLYHWTDAGTPTWKSQVPAACVGQKVLTPLCRAAFEQADVAFAAGLALTLIDVTGHR